MRIYLAGPMRGYPELNFPAFHEAARKLRDQGHVVFSPTEANLPSGFDQAAADSLGPERRHVFYLDTKIICLEVDAIALLTGWESSSGAFAEWALARALGLKIIYLGS